MPRIPTRPGPQIAQAPDQTPFQSVAAPAAAFGGPVADAIGGFGTALQQAAADLERSAVENKRTKAKALENQYRRQLRQLEFGAEGSPGYFDSRGQTAVEGFEPFQEGAEKALEDLASTTDDPEIAALFRNSAGTLLESSLEGAQRYRLEQVRNAANDVSQARVIENTQDAAFKWNNEEFVQQRLNSVRSEVFETGARNGQSPEVVDNLLEEAESNFWSEVITHAASQDVVAARELFDDKKRFLEPAAERDLEENLTDLDEVRRVNASLAEVLALNEDQVESRNWVRENVPDDIQGEVMRQLGNEFTAQRLARSKAVDDLESELFGLVQGGAQVDALARSDPERWQAVQAVPGLPERLRTAESQFFAGQTFSETPNLKAENDFMRMTAREQANFDLNRVINQVTEEQFTSLQDAQLSAEKAIESSGQNAAAFNDARTALKQTAPSDFNFDTPKKQSDDEEDQQKVVESEMRRFVNRVIDETGKPPTAAERRAEAERLWSTIAVPTDPFFVSSTLELLGFEGLTRQEFIAESQRSMTPRERSEFAPKLDQLDEDLVTDLRNRLRSTDGIEDVPDVIIENMAGAFLMGDNRRFQAIRRQLRPGPQAPRASLVPRRALPTQEAPAEEPVAPVQPAPEEEGILGPLLEGLVEEPQEPVESVPEEPVVDTEEGEGASLDEPLAETGGLSFTDRVAQIESGGDPDAQARTSTAVGLFQFVENTWLEEIQQHAPEAAEGLSREEILELRRDPEVATQVFEGFTADNARGLEGSGFEATPRNLYLAHFLGLGGARAALRAPPGKAVPTRVARSNPFLRGKDHAFLLAWADRKIRGA